MDWLTTIPLIVGVISNLSALAMETLAQRLVTIMLAVVIIGGVGVFALSAFAWLWLKRTVVELQPPATTARH
jgi:bacteriorhodopsin